MRTGRYQFGQFGTTADFAHVLAHSPRVIILDLKGGLKVQTRDVRPTAPTPGPNPATGLVTIHGHLELNDYEQFSSDEHVKLDNLIAWTHVDDQFVPRFYWEGRCGGEVRLEVDMLCGINPTAPDVLEFSAHARLYEGTSTSTTDQDGFGNFHIQVDRGIPSGIFGLVQNTEEDQPMDWGIFSFGVRFD
jgi:hypothetical protein